MLKYVLCYLDEYGFCRNLCCLRGHSIWATPRPDGMPLLGKLRMLPIRLE
jgi:hypothetical protein